MKLGSVMFLLDLATDILLLVRGRRNRARKVSGLHEGIILTVIQLHFLLTTLSGSHESCFYLLPKSRD